MRKKSIWICLLACVMTLFGCGDSVKPYMSGGHAWGDERAAVEARGDADNILGLKTKGWVYMYTTDGILKGEACEMDESVTIEAAVEAFTKVCGEGTLGYRGDNQEYVEYSWLDDDNRIYIMQKNDGGNVIIQIQKKN